MIERNEVHHEVLPYDEDEDFEQGNREVVVRKGTENSLESILISVATNPIATITIVLDSLRDTESHQESFNGSSDTYRNSFQGTLPKRWQ